MHRDADKFKFFSRNGLDNTDDFGHSPADPTKFCFHLNKSLESSVKSVILDGEICAFNHISNALGTVNPVKAITEAAFPAHIPLTSVDFSQVWFIIATYMTGKMLLAEFDYENKPQPSFPFNTAKERYSMWLLKKYLLPWLYWNKMMKGSQI